MKIKFIVIVCLLAGFLIPLLGFSTPVGAAAGDSVYENFTTGDDAGKDISGPNWTAQTFTTGAVAPHTANQVRVRVYRVGSPGTLTASIYETSADHPAGLALTSGTISGDGVTTATSGSWYFIDLDEQVFLESDTMYGLTLSASTGDGSNKVCWRYDNGGGYADGAEETSTDGGFSWSTVGANDMMFEIWGGPGIQVVGVSVFTNFIEEGDQLFVFPYKALVDPSYTAQNPSDFFNIQLLANTSLKAQIKLPAWGYKPGSIYLDADVALAWNTNLTIVQIEGITGGDFSGDASNYTLEAVDWKGSDLEALDDWVFATAGALENYYDVTLVETIEGGYILNPAGTTIFNIGIPGLHEIRPSLFGMAEMPTLPGAENHTTDYQDTLTGNFGATAAAAFESLGDLIGVGGTFLSGAFWLVIIIMGVSVMGLAVGHPGVGLICAIPLVFVGNYLNLIPLEYVLLPVFLGGLYVLAKLTIWRA